MSETSATLPQEQHPIAPSREGPVTKAEIQDTKPAQRLGETIGTGTPERMVVVGGNEYPGWVESTMYNNDQRRDKPDVIDYRRHTLRRLMRHFEQRALDEAAGVHETPTAMSERYDVELAYSLDAGLLTRGADGKLEIVEVQTPSTVGVARLEFRRVPDAAEVYQGPQSSEHLYRKGGFIEVKARTGKQGDPADEKTAEKDGRRQYGRLAVHEVAVPESERTQIAARENPGKSESEIRYESYKLYKDRLAFDPDTTALKDREGNALPYGSPENPLFELQGDTVAIYTGTKDPVTYETGALQNKVLGVRISEDMKVLITRPNGENGSLVVGVDRDLPLMPLREPLRRAPLVEPVRTEPAVREEVIPPDTPSVDEVVTDVPQERVSKIAEIVKRSPGWERLKRLIAPLTVVGGLTAATFGIGLGGDGPTVSQPFVPMPENGGYADTMDEQPKASILSGGQLGGERGVASSVKVGETPLAKNAPKPVEVATSHETTPRKTVDYDWIAGDVKSEQGFIDAQKGIAYLVATGRTRELHDLGISDETIQAIERGDAVKVQIDLDDEGNRNKLAEVLKPLRESGATPEDKALNDAFDAYARQQIKALNPTGIVGPDDNFTGNNVLFIPVREQADNLAQMMVTTRTQGGVVNG